jgi:hypothetical protein
MADETTHSPEDKAAGATILLAGFLTSALFLVAASILWVGFLLAATLGGAGDGKLDGGELMAGVITLSNAAMFYLWGIYGLGKSRQALKAALAKKGPGADRT